MRSPSSRSWKSWTSLLASLPQLQILDLLRNPTIKRFKASIQQNGFALRQPKRRSLSLSSFLSGPRHHCRCNSDSQEERRFRLPYLSLFDFSPLNVLHFTARRQQRQPASQRSQHLPMARPGERRGDPQPEPSPRLRRLELAGRTGDRFDSP